jgi:hypothetical protein
MSDDTASTLSAEQADAVLRQRLRGRVRQLRLLVGAEGIVLQGVAANYYGKQLAQHHAHKLLGLLVRANESRSARLPRCRWTTTTRPGSGRGRCPQSAQ